jgi:hypothetical protein
MFEKADFVSWCRICSPIIKHWKNQSERSETASHKKALGKGEFYSVQFVLFCLSAGTKSVLKRRVWIIWGGSGLWLLHSPRDRGKEYNKCESCLVILHQLLRLFVRVCGPWTLTERYITYQCCVRHQDFCITTVTHVGTWWHTVAFTHSHSLKQPLT